MSNRRKFITDISATILATFLTGVYIKGNAVSKLPFIIDNPYQHVNWETTQFVPSTSHIHIQGQDKLDRVYQNLGLRYIPISNYYPSTPYYPADKIRENQFRVSQDFMVMTGSNFSKKGSEKWDGMSLKNGPFNWNKIIMKNKEWYNSLAEEEKKQLPFKLGGRLFTNIPQDLIISPNAEHHSFTNVSLHANGVGSLYSSGTFDERNRFKTLEHGYHYGTALPWETVFKKILDNLIFMDGGGVTINHPVWSHLNFAVVCSMLDFDQRVMGIEIFNDTCATLYGDPNLGWALKLWDEILITKRRCLGFCVPDHSLGRGRNILLVPQFSEHECLRAYRKGAFFGAINGTGLRFNKISFEHNKLKVELNKESQIIILTDKGVTKKAFGNSLEYDVPMSAVGKPSILFLRVEAVDEISEHIFSQPIRFL